MTAQRTRPPIRRAAAAVLAALASAAVLVLGSAATAPDARADLRDLEKELKAAIGRVEVATVVVVPADGPGPELSGVLVSKSGLVLTHAESGQVWKNEKGAWKPDKLSEQVEVRLPDLRHGTFTNYRGRVVRRIPELASALVKIENPPPAGFSSYLTPDSSGDVTVGQFTFVMGNSFGMASETPPSLTAGIVCAVDRPRGTTDQGGCEVFYTTAAVNPGVNGGPVVDVRGRLVGIVMSWVDAQGEPESPFQFLGRVMPMDRLRTAWASDPTAKDAFSASPPRALDVTEAPALETVIARTSSRARGAVVSLDVRRKQPVSSIWLTREAKPVQLPRYRGPISAFVGSEDGLIVTALYDVTNLSTLRWPAMAAAIPPEATTKAGIDAIEGATAHLADGRDLPATLVAVHEGLGLAVFRAELPEGSKLPKFDAAPAEAFAEGRFALALGNPFGAKRWKEPFVTFGVLSKRHADDAPDPWRGHWQTDARATDGNCGGAVVDLRGRMLGMLTLWDTAQHGRASGIGFLLPWSKIAEVLPEMGTGRSFRRPFLGVQWEGTAEDPLKVKAVVQGSGAAAAGMAAGDVIVEIDGVAVDTTDDLGTILSKHWAGDVLRIRVRRGGNDVDLRATLGARD